MKYSILFAAFLSFALFDYVATFTLLPSCYEAHRDFLDTLPLDYNTKLSLCEGNVVAKYFISCWGREGLLPLLLIEVFTVFMVTRLMHRVNFLRRGALTILFFLSLSHLIGGLSWIYPEHAVFSPAIGLLLFIITPAIFFIIIILPIIKGELKCGER